MIRPFRFSPGVASACTPLRLLWQPVQPGVILDWQLALVDESSLPEAIKAKIARMDGSETAVLGQGCAVRFRAFCKPGERAFFELKELETQKGLARNSAPEVLDGWEEAVTARVASQELLLAGQDACFAAPLANEFRTLRAVCGAIRRQAFRQVRVAARKDNLREGSALAESHGTRYPILQGPMTRVSDRADFARAVAADGALPFLALALMRGPQVGSLLAETKEKLGELPWGVGILGFVPRNCARNSSPWSGSISPPFASSPAAARIRRSSSSRRVRRPTCTCRRPNCCGVFWPGSPQVHLRRPRVRWPRRATLQHRPVGRMIRVIFPTWNRQGREAGRVPLRLRRRHPRYAFGRHGERDRRGLVERGGRTGVLLGTVTCLRRRPSLPARSSDVPAGSVECRNTMLVESGAGHATRCADTAFVETFAREKQRLSANAREEEIREPRTLNLGRLRIASKGLKRRPVRRQDSVTKRSTPEEQRREGMYMIGQLAALRNKITTIAAFTRVARVRAPPQPRGIPALPWPRRKSQLRYRHRRLSTIFPKARR